MFYLTTVGGSAQHPSGRKDEVYVRSPGNTEWKVLSEVVQNVRRLLNTPVACGTIEC